MVKKKSSTITNWEASEATLIGFLLEIVGILGYMKETTDCAFPSDFFEANLIVKPGRVCSLLFLRYRVVLKFHSDLKRLMI